LEHSLEIFRALRKGQLLMLPATGHNTFRQTPDLLNPAILKFLGAP
jgi:pimeloyl-ACP methyl ester carboxylesterase